MRMSWHDLLFIHWQVDKTQLASKLPAGMQLDTFSDQAWIGIVPFHMSDVAPRFVPAMPWLSAFPELNIRTYVTVDGKPGVWFFSLDAPNPMAVRVARTAFHLPYMDAQVSIQADGDWYDYSSRRTHRGEASASLEVRYRATGEPFLAEPGTLEYWLTARYCLYAANARGQLFRGEIDHPPWPLQPAELQIQENSMLDWLGLEVSGPPHILFAKEVAVKAWINQRC